MKLFTKNLTLIFSLLHLSLYSYCQQKDDYSFKIDSLIQTSSPRNFNGVILITQKGKTVYSKAFGYSDFENKTPLTLKNKFRIQSNSKQITAVLVLKEVEKGKIDLNSPIRKYLPELPKTWADSVTVHQLLNFSAGITEIDKPLAFKPGTDHLYGATAYTLLAKIIEKVTGKTFTAVAKTLFEDLGMKNTLCDTDNLTQNKAVKGFTNVKNSFKPIEIRMNEQDKLDFLPAGGIISNAEDLNIWDTKLHKGKLLKPEIYKLMTTYDITAKHETFGNEKVGYGYGIRVSDKSAIKHIGHSGKGLGFVSIKVYFPEKDVDLIVLENFYSEDSNFHYHFEKEIKGIVMSSSLVK